jgi:hypothetical protein
MAIAYSVLSNGGLMGGDCPDPMSYGSVTVFGTAQDASGSPLSGLRISVKKPKGLCPQSYEENRTLISNEQGYFEGSIYFHLGDPHVSIMVDHDGYWPYEFKHLPLDQETAIKLSVIVGNHLDVQWTYFSLDSSFFTIVSPTLPDERPR